MLLNDTPMTLFSPQALRAMKSGAVIETEGLFQGVTPEPCVWIWAGGNKEAGEFVFHVFYFGIKIAEYRALIVDEKTVELEAL